MTDEPRNADICPPDINPVMWWIEKARFYADHWPHSSHVIDCLRKALDAAERKP